MTQQKTFKRRVRARMAKTGESYTAARRQLLPDAPPAEPVFEPTVAEERVVEATGHGWDHWFAALDEWGARERSHTEIARWLRDDHGVPGWYSQAISVSYERARGMRAVGEGVNGFTVSVSRTVGVPAEQLFAAFDDPARRERWLPGAERHGPHDHAAAAGPLRLGRRAVEAGGRHRGARRRPRAREPVARAPGRRGRARPPQAVVARAPDRAQGAARGHGRVAGRRRSVGTTHAARGVAPMPGRARPS